jgi:hypothetical protein
MKLWDKIIGCCIMTMHCLALFFTSEFFNQKNSMTAIPHPPYFYVSLTEMIEVDPQVVLNTLKEHGFQDAFTKLPEALEMVHMREKGLLRG